MRFLIIASLAVIVAGCSAHREPELSLKDVRVVSRTPVAAEAAPPVKKHPCDCPRDRDSWGRECGGRSAYSKPGGRAPKCAG